MKEIASHLDSAAFSVKFPEQALAADHGFDAEVDALGVFVRDDGELAIEEWQTSRHRTTGLPISVASTIHSPVNKAALATLLCGEPNASLDALHSAMSALALISKADLLDKIGSSSEHSYETDGME